MSPSRVLCLLLLAVLGCAVEVTQAVQTEGGRSILFIGNSLTFYNDLPKLFASLAKAGGEGELTVDAQVVGGASLKKHWDDGIALGKIQAHPWTWIVVQDMSTGTTKHEDDFTTYGTKFIDAIKAQHAKPVLYMTWALRGEMPSQTLITQEYQQLGAATGAVVVPAGRAVDAYRQVHGDASLFKDNRHPTFPGSYLVACCFYATLFNRDPQGLPALGKLDAATATELQHLAWSVH